MAVYVLTVDGVVVNFHAETLNINEVLNGSDVMDVRIDSYDNTYRIPKNKTVTVTEDGVRIFGGVTDQPKEQAFESDIRGTAISNLLTATDFNVLADRRIMYGATVPAGTLKAALQYVVTNYLGAHGVTLHIGQVDGPSLSAIVLNFQTVRDFLNFLFELTGYVWEIDYSQVLRMILPGSELAPFNLAAGDNRVLGDIRVEDDYIDYANRIIVRYMAPAVQAYAFLEAYANFLNNDFVTIDSQEYKFQTVLTNDEGNVLIGATANDSISNLIAAINGGAGSGTLYAAKTHANNKVTAIYQSVNIMRLRAVEAGASGNSISVASHANNVLWYTEGGGATMTLLLGKDTAMTNVVVRNHAAEQTAQGIHEMVLELPNVTDLGLATTAGDDLLAIRILLRKIVTYTTPDPGLHPGQVQTITIPLRGLSGSFLITDVKTENTESERVVRVVTAVGGTKFLGTWREIYSSLGGGGSNSMTFSGSLSGGGGGGGTVLGSGTINAVPLWTAANTLGNSVMSQSGAVVTVAGTMTATTVTGTWNGTRISAPYLFTVAQDTILGRAALAGTGDFGAMVTLPTGVQDNISRLGTITSGVWNAGNLTTTGSITGGSLSITPGNVVLAGTLDVAQGVYSRSHFFVHNKLATGWLEWVTRDITGAEAVVNLRFIKDLTQTGAASMGTITSGNITSSGTIAAGLFSGSGASLTNLPAIQLTGTTMAANVVISSLTTVGTITTGVWNAGSVTSSGSGSFGTTLFVTQTATVAADLAPNVNYTSNIGSLPKKFLTLHAAELWVETLVAVETQATIGGRILVGPTTTLTADLGPQVATPAAPTVAVQGVAGTTSYSYRVAAHDATGRTLASAAGTTTTGNALLSGANFNRVTWAAVTGATTYSLYGRSGGSELLIVTTAALTYDDTGAVTPAGALPTANTTVATIVVKHNQMTSADHVRMEAAGKLEFMLVDGWPIVAVDTIAEWFDVAGDWTSVFTAGRTFFVRSSTGNNGTWTVSSSAYTAGTDRTRITVTGNITNATADGHVAYLDASTFTYRVQRDTDGTGANQWFAGDAIFNTGTTGKGFIDLYSSGGVVAGVGPAIVGNVRTGAAHNAVAPRWAIGNLNGVYGYATEVYGAAFGDNAGAWIKIDATNGVRLGHAAVTKVSIDAAGNASFAGAVTSTSGTIGGWTIGATSIYSGAGANFVSIDSGGSNPAMYAGNSSDSLAPFRVSRAGALTAKSGTIGGWTISDTALTAPTGASLVAGGVSMSDQGLYVSPVGSATYANANAVRWTSDTTYRTAIWRSDEAIESYRRWKFEHLGLYDAGGVFQFQLDMTAKVTNGATFGQGHLQFLTESRTGLSSKAVFTAMNSDGNNAGIWLEAPRTGNNAQVRLGLGGFSTALSVSLNTGPALTTGITILPNAITVLGVTSFTNGVTASSTLVVNGTLTAQAAINATGGFATTLSGTISERGRTTPIGEWIAITFAAGNYTTDVGTWTVGSTDVITSRYTMIGKTMIFSFTIASTDVASSPLQLRIAIPGGFVSAQRMDGQVTIKDSGGTPQQGQYYVAAAGTVINIEKNDGLAFLTATGTTNVTGHAVFEVQ